MTSPLRIGILGAANIARQFTHAVRNSPHVTVVAVASRAAQTATAFASACGIATAHGSYEALLANPQVDIVYIPLPNSVHAQWAIKAAQAGKHVLCEKPLAMNLAEATAMFDAARQHGVMLLEAFPYYFQPQTRDMLALVHGGTIGTVQSVQASFGFVLGNPLGNIRMNPTLGGGALLDAGSYPLSLIRLVMGERPVSVFANAVMSAEGVDVSTIATLLYANGRSAQLSCAMNTANHRHATIMGTLGTLESEYLNHTASGPGHPLGYQPSLLRVRRGTANTVPFEVIASASGSGFYFCVEAFAQKIRAQDFAAIERAAQASLDNAATLAAIAQSARSAQTVIVGESQL
jgi:predicted dehydrogenase